MNSTFFPLRPCETRIFSQQTQHPARDGTNSIFQQNRMKSPNSIHGDGENVNNHPTRTASGIQPMFHCAGVVLILRKRPKKEKKKDNNDSWEDSFRVSRKDWFCIFLTMSTVNVTCLLVSIVTTSLRFSALTE